MANPAGRPPGIPDKPKRRFLARLEQDFPGYHPIAALAEMVHNEDLEAPLRAKIHADIAQYVVPKLKAMELSTATGAPIIIQAVQGDGDL